MGLFERWERESRAAGTTEKTIKEYRSVLTRFVTFLEHDDATRVTPRDVVAWKDKRLEDGRSPKTVKDVDLSAMKSIFGWAVRNHQLATNPASGVTVKLGKKTRLRGLHRPRGAHHPHGGPAIHGSSLRAPEDSGGETVASLALRLHRGADRRGRAAAQSGHSS